MGAIAGGAMGNAVGGGAGKAAGTMIGIMGGAIVGDTVEGFPMAQVHNVQRCSVQTFFENRTVAYNVVYEYAGKRYSVQMPNDPGPTVQLQISPVGANSQGITPTNTVIYQQPVDMLPATMSMAQPIYPVIEQRAYNLPVSLNLGIGYWGGDGGRHYHSHWR